MLFSLAFGAGFVDITITTRIGAGVTGTQKGGDAATRTFAYAFYGSGTLANISFTPTVTSDTTKATYPGTNNPGAFGSAFTIAYNYIGTDFTCVTTTAACGNVHTDTVTVTIRSNELPDSIRALGIEGAGNPFGGCYPDADMLINLNVLPVVWAGFDATAQEYGVNLDWTTASESNNDLFLVQRSIDGGGTYKTIGEVEAVGNSKDASSYNFFDSQPESGVNLYKIVQMDIDGHQSESEVQEVIFNAPTGMMWTQIGPNPVREQLSLGYYVDQNQPLNLRIVDLRGRVLVNRELDAMAGNNMLQVDMSGYEDGFYSLQLQGQAGVLEQRVIKL